MSKKTEDHAERIRQAMQKAGIYEERFEFQIAEAANTIEEIEAMRKVVKREGRVVTETKTAGVGVKKEAHPLIVQINNFKRTYIQELAALGLNKMSEKKAEAKSRKNEDDPLTEQIRAMQDNG